MTLNRHFFLFALALLAVCTLAVALIFAFGSDDSGSSTLVVAAIAFAVAALCLGVEARRDLDAVLIFLGFCLLAAALFEIVYLFSEDHPGIAPKIPAGAAGAAAIACGAMTYRRQRRASPNFPNLLASFFKNIHELEGVQYVGYLKPGGDGSPHAVSILLQNCFESPRQVTVRFDAAPYAKYLRFLPQHRVSLGAAEVSKVEFPVVSPTYPGSYRLYFSIEVAGEEGRRVRLWRARTAEARTTTATTLARLAVGHLSVGGGVYLTVGPLPDDLWGIPLPAPVQTSLWRPAPGTVPLAVSERDRPMTPR